MDFSLVFLSPPLTTWAVCCRTCRTRTSTGTRPASSATSAACRWWTSSSAPSWTRSSAPTVTMRSSPPAATAAARSSKLVSPYHPLTHVSNDPYGYDFQQEGNPEIFVLNILGKRWNTKGSRYVYCTTRTTGVDGLNNYALFPVWVEIVYCLDRGGLLAQSPDRILGLCNHADWLLSSCVILSYRIKHQKTLNGRRLSTFNKLLLQERIRHCLCHVLICL